MRRVCRSFQEISSTGRNVCRVNGKVVTLSMFKEVGTHIIDLYGQFEYHKIHDPRANAEYPDHFGGDTLEPVKEKKVSACYERVRNLDIQINNFSKKKEETREKESFLSYQLNEIDAADPKIGEEEELEEEIKILSGSGILTQGSREIYSLLFGDNGRAAAVYDLLSDIVKILQEMSDYDSSLQEKAKEIDSISYMIQDLAEYFRSYGENIEFSPDRLFQLEARLGIINQLKNKYNKTIREILEFRKEIAAALEDLHFSDEKLKKLQDKRDEAHREYMKYAEELSALRRTAEELSQEVVHALRFGNENGVPSKIPSFKGARQTRA